MTAQKEVAQKKGPAAASADPKVKEYASERENYPVEGGAGHVPLDEASRFLTALDPKAEAFTFQTLDDRKDKRLIRVLHGTLEQHRAELRRLNDQGAGIFVTVNETDLKARKAENIIRVRAVFVDLDGAPLEPVLGWLKPHIVVETSPGKWHAYWRVVDLPLDQFEPVQNALIARFNGDKAVKDLPRVMRMPGFVHRKGPPFVTRIVEINDHAPYAGSEFEPAKPEEPVPEEPTEEPVGQESVPTKKKKERTNSRVINTTALRNLPAWVPELFGKAAVLSGDTYRITSKALGRPLEEDLSFSPKGIKDFGVHDLDDSRQGKRSPIDLVMEYGNKSFPEAVGWLCERLGISRPSITLDDFRAYLPMHNYIFDPTGDVWPAASINGLFYPKASVFLDQNRPVHQMAWIPGEPKLIHDRVFADGGWKEQEGVVCFNQYRPPVIHLGDSSQAGPWLDHVDRLYPQDRSHIVNCLAFKVQHPGIKTNHAVVFGGVPGIGKDTILEPVKQGVGPWNFKEVGPEQLLGNFNPHVRSVILRINEARDLGEINRYQFYERLKSYTASPPDVLSCNEKHLRQYDVMNVCLVIITTNHRTDSLYLPPEDRRHYVTWSEALQSDFDADYFNWMYGWYGSGGHNHVAAYLMQHDLSSFDPKAPPLKTQAFWDIVDTNRAPEESELSDIIDQLGNPNALLLEDLIDKADGDLRFWLTDRKNRRAIPHRLEKCGYVRVRNNDANDGYYVIGGRRQPVYAKADISPSERFAAAAELVKATRPPRSPRGDYGEPM